MIKKDITFIWTHSITHRQVFEPVAEEAENRGYSVRFSENPFEKCEIGFYCDHVNFPRFSKFSVIMLHDLTQGYGRWPDLWFQEPWNKYDVGILPGDVWANNWKSVSQYFYTRPRHGIYKIGWPKADRYGDNEKNEIIRRKFRNHYRIDASRPSVLYAPSWENDNKQDDFVRAMQTLDVNILIKQTHCPYPIINQNVEVMQRLHEKLPNVYIIDPDSNIFDAISVADVLVSEESSTMLEAILMGIPPVQVTDWLVPDTYPCRYPSTKYDYTNKTEKNNLAATVGNILNHYDSFKNKALSYRDSYISNIGHSSGLIMDIIDSFADESKPRTDCVLPNKKVDMAFGRKALYMKSALKREITGCWCERNPMLKAMYTFYRHRNKNNNPNLEIDL